MEAEHAVSPEDQLMILIAAAIVYVTNSVFETKELLIA